MMRQVKLSPAERLIEMALQRGEYQDVDAAEFAQIAKALASRRNKARPDPNLPLGKLTRIKDVLPRPEQLIGPQKSKKVDGRRKAR